MHASQQGVGWQPRCDSFSSRIPAPQCWPSALPWRPPSSTALHARKNENHDDTRRSRGSRPSGGLINRPSSRRSRDVDKDDGLGWWQKPEESSLSAYATKPLEQWQITRLEQAALVGRRKVQVQEVAAELGLGREDVIAWFKEFALLPESERVAILTRVKAQAQAAASKAAVRQLADRAAGISVEEKKTASQQGFVPFAERKQQGVDKKKRLSADAIRTLNSVYQRTPFPSDDVINGLWDLHRMSRAVALNWFTARRAQDGIVSSSQKRRPEGGSAKARRADDWSRGLEEDGPGDWEDDGGDEGPTSSRRHREEYPRARTPARGVAPPPSPPARGERRRDAADVRRTDRGMEEEEEEGGSEGWGAVSSGGGGAFRGDAVPEVGGAPRAGAAARSEVVAMSRSEMAMLRSSLPSPRKVKGQKLAAQLNIKTGSGKDASTVIGGHHFVPDKARDDADAADNEKAKWSRSWRQLRRSGPPTGKGG